MIATVLIALARLAVARRVRAFRLGESARHDGPSWGPLVTCDPRTAPNPTTAAVAVAGEVLDASILDDLVAGAGLGQSAHHDGQGHHDGGDQGQDQPRAADGEQGSEEPLAGRERFGERPLEDNDYVVADPLDSDDVRLPREPDHAELDESHGRITRRSLWVTGAAGVDFPHVSQAARIRRESYGRDGTLISRETVHAVTSLGKDQADAAALAKIARGQWGIESVHWLRDTAYREDANTGYAGNGPHAMATLRNLAVSLLHLSGVTEITRTLQAITRDRNRILNYLPL